MFPRMLPVFLFSAAGEAPGGGGASTPAQTPAPPSTDEAAPALRLMREEISRLTEQLKARDAEVATVTTERDTLKIELDKRVRLDLEGQLIGRLRKDLPHADEVVLRGTVALLAEGGRVNRFPKADELDATAAAALELIRKEAPSLTRAPASGGGIGGAPVRPEPPQPDPVRDLFRPIRKP